MVRLPESEHHYWANLNVWTAQPVEFSARGCPAAQAQKSADRPTPWIAIGPFESPKEHVFDKIFVLPDHVHERATLERFQQIWKAGELSDADLKEPFVRPMLADMVATRDVYAISRIRSRREIRDRRASTIQMRCSATMLPGRRSTPPTMAPACACSSSSPAS